MCIIVRKSTVLLILQLILLSGIVAQSVTIQTELDTHNILPGRFANLKYIINKKAGTEIILPHFGDTLYDAIELVGKVKIDSGNSVKEQEKLEQSIVLTAYEPGLWLIPPQPFVIKTQHGNDTVFSAASYLQVDSIAIDTTGIIRDIKNVEWIMPTLRDFIPFIIALAIMGLVVFLILRFWPGAKKRSSKNPVVVSEPPHIVALRELDKLKAQKLWQQKQTKEYYSRLTAIIRTYIEHQFGLKALEQTSGEIINDIQRLGLESKLNSNELKKLLSLADLVKFAKGDAQPEENIEHLERAYDFVKLSRQAIMEEAVKSAADVVKDNLSNSYEIARKSRNAKRMSDLQIFQELEKGGRLVKYHYTISVIVMTFSLKSKIHLLRAGEKGIKPGLIFSSITLLLGWWGIPWGPVKSVHSIKTNFSGGQDVELGRKSL